MRLLAALLLAGCAVGPAAGAAQKVRLRAGQTDLSVSSLRQAGEVAGRLHELRWRVAQPGLRWTELDLAAGAMALPVRAIAVRIEPRCFDFRLHALTRPNGVSGAWTIDALPENAALALNAGQFKEAGPWGWLVIDGQTEGLPGTGSLAAGLAFDSTGAVHWIEPARIEKARRSLPFRHAFQSYPLLLLNRRIPEPLLDKRMVDASHRDARLVLAETADSALLIVLTRFDAMRSMQRVPIGLTIPESVVLMRALGARHAVMLDGGISAQLAVRDRTMGIARWPGLRAVPLGLIASPRSPQHCG